VAAQNGKSAFFLYIKNICNLILYIFKDKNDVNVQGYMKN